MAMGMMPSYTERLGVSATAEHQLPGQLQGGGDSPGRLNSAVYRAGYFGIVSGGHRLRKIGAAGRGGPIYWKAVIHSWPAYTRAA